MVDKESRPARKLQDLIAETDALEATNLFRRWLLLGQDNNDRRGFARSLQVPH